LNKIKIDVEFQLKSLGSKSKVRKHIKRFPIIKRYQHSVYYLSELSNKGNVWVQSDKAKHITPANQFEENCIMLIKSMWYLIIPETQYL
jgi:hypothetical protein